MKDEKKTKEQLSDELVTLRQRIAALGALEVERKRAEETLRQYAFELQARNEELDSFAGAVARDLVQPLGVIIGFAEALEENYALLSDEDLRRYLYTIARKARDMHDIIDELLLRAIVRKTDVEMVPLDMASVLAEVLQRLDRMGERAQADVVLPESWPAALGHEPWVVAVWTSLLHIAIKYGARPPRLELGGTPLSIPFDRPVLSEAKGLRAGPPDVGGEAKGGMVRFWIRTGDPGLTPEEQARLSTPLTPAAAVEGRPDQVRIQVCISEMSVVRCMVEKMGGRVGVESEVGQGSVFSFTLPGVTGGARS